MVPLESSRVCWHEHCTPKLGKSCILLQMTIGMEKCAQNQIIQ